MSILLPLSLKQDLPVLPTWAQTLMVQVILLSQPPE
jgi:hypothetical protein